MISWIFNRAHDLRTARNLYGATVAQARTPTFFREFGTADTPEGRSAMIILHVFLLVDRIGMSNERSTRVSRYVTETFVTDMDDCMREMGVGDLTVPKKVKRAAQALGERCLGYRHALHEDEYGARLAAELVASIPGMEHRPDAAVALAGYVVEARAHLTSLDLAEILDGRISYPAPVYH